MTNWKPARRARKTRLGRGGVAVWALTATLLAATGAALAGGTGGQAWAAAPEEASGQLAMIVRVVAGGGASGGTLPVTGFDGSWLVVAALAVAAGTALAAAARHSRRKAGGGRVADAAEPTPTGGDASGLGGEGRRLLARRLAEAANRKPTSQKGHFGWLNPRRRTLAGSAAGRPAAGWAMFAAKALSWAAFGLAVFGLAVFGLAVFGFAVAAHADTSEKAAVTVVVDKAKSLTGQAEVKFDAAELDSKVLRVEAVRGATDERLAKAMITIGQTRLTSSPATVVEVRDKDFTGQVASQLTVQIPQDLPAGEYRATVDYRAIDQRQTIDTARGAAKTKTYDGTTTLEVDGTVTPSGLPAGTDVKLEGVTLTAAAKKVDAAAPVTVEASGLGGADAWLYKLAAKLRLIDASGKDATVAITPKTVTLTGLSAADKVYDGTTTATLTGRAALSGVIAGDGVAVGQTPAAQFADKNVGAAKSVTLATPNLVGADAGNYTLAKPAALTAAITAKPVTLTGLTAADKVYDGTTTATISGTPAFTAGVIVAGDTVTITGAATGAFADSSVGAGKTVAVSGLGLGGASSGNYLLTAPTLKASITAKPVTITGLSAADKVYDGAVTATVTGTPAFPSGAILAGDTVTITGSATGAFADKTAGTAKTVTVSGHSLGGADAADYKLTEPTLSAAITPRPVRITGLTAQNKVYDGTTDATLTGTPALAAGDVIVGDDVKPAGTPRGQFDTKHVGAAKTVAVSGNSLTGADAANYSLRQPSLSATVTAAPVTFGGTVLADREIDDTDPTHFTVTSVANPTSFTGVKTGEQLSLNKAGIKQVTLPAASYAAEGVAAATATFDASILEAGNADTSAADYTLSSLNVTADVVVPLTLRATTSAAGQTVVVSRYFSNQYTVDWGDGSAVQNSGPASLSHPYTAAGTYTIKLKSALAGPRRWTFPNPLTTVAALVPSSATAQTVVVQRMPAIRSFMVSDTAAGDYFFTAFNYKGKLTGLPAGSFDTSAIVTAGRDFFNGFNQEAGIVALPAGSFKLTALTT
ncbi:MAG: YDG domain-containing protein, partial [Bifidobacteriaceae bacterium]|nr:YDG domain-containing protein [Bifidobacteriaceae bacterium]